MIEFVERVVKLVIRFQILASKVETPARNSCVTAVFPRHSFEETLLSRTNFPGLCSPNYILVRCDSIFPHSDRLIRWICVWYAYTFTVNHSTTYFWPLPVKAFLIATIFIISPYFGFVEIWGIKGNRPLRVGAAKSGDERIGQVFYLCHRWFDRLSASCCTQRRPSIIRESASFYIFNPHGADSPDTHIEKWTYF